MGIVITGPYENSFLNAKMPKESGENHIDKEWRIDARMDARLSRPEPQQLWTRALFSLSVHLRTKYNLLYFEILDLLVEHHQNELS